MRVNLEWLREWVDVDLDGLAVAELLTTAGLEVDSVIELSKGLDGIVVGRVDRVDQHPNADKLMVCRVSDGKHSYDVVCGAPNVCEGIRVPFAPVGATIPGGKRIEATKLRGVTSNGMLCSGKELGLSDDASGLMLLDADAPVGTSIVEHLKLADAVLDIDLTPNRGDCFSIIGIAREIAANTKRDLRGPRMPDVDATTETRFDVKLSAPDACPRFAGRVIEGVANDARSPLWMRERLRRAGLRSINPVVDVTNYVMLELGQPLHAYDLSRLERRIAVRLAKSSERLVLLDGRDIELDNDVLVIADDSGAIGLAGIMGGQDTSVSTSTRDVFFEAAHFAPTAIAGRARRYGLHTDASLRFERGVDPDAPRRAIERATELLLEIAGGRCGPTMLTEMPEHVPVRAPIDLSHERLEATLGISIGSRDVESVLRRLNNRVDTVDAGWRVTPPSFRFDLNIEEDLVEEVARLVGYDRIPARAGQLAAHLGAATEATVPIERAADLLIDRGYQEIITYSFVDKALDERVNPGQRPIELLNPISSELAVMRLSLWPGLLLAAQKNLTRQSTDFRLFECGPQFRRSEHGIEESQVIAGIAVGRRVPEHWDQKEPAIDFYDIKHDVEALLGLSGNGGQFTFCADEHPALKPGHTARVMRGDRTIGWLGALHPALQRDLEIRVPSFLFGLRTADVLATTVPKYEPFSKFPYVRRDIAVVVDEAVTADELRHHIINAGGPLLSDVLVFDVYRGPGIDSTRKSVALGLILQDASRTLTDGDAERALESVIERLEKELGATIRT